MRNLKLTLVAGLLSMTITASAQFANTGNSSTSALTDNYNRVTVSYNPQTIIPDYDGADNKTLAGFSLGYTKGISISQKHPLFVEVGARLNYAFKSYDYFGMDEDDLDEEDKEDFDYYFSDHKQKFSYMHLAIPVNLAYKFNVGNNISITPYIGVVFKANILAKESYNINFTEDGEDEYEWIYDDIDEFKDENGYNDKNYFDKKDVGKDATWKRFQIGWNIGAGVDYKQWYFGLSYGSDFMEVAKKMKTSNFAINLGYNF